jgi:hypothetical protein
MMSGDEGKNFRQDPIDGDERVPPLADSRQCGRGIPVELRNGIEGEPTFQEGDQCSPPQ